MCLSLSCSPLKTDSSPAIKLLLPVVALLLLLAGCATTQGGMRSGQAEAVASIKVYVPSPMETTSAGNDARCEIKSIDGAAADSSDSLTPGKHRLILALRSADKEYVGDADLVIPAAKNYRLKAERKDDSFTLSLVEVDTAKTVATSTAPLNQTMKFLVFVIQK